MNTIILYTKMSSIRKHWNNALEKEYKCVNISEIDDLVSYVDSREDSIVCMIDELSLSDVTMFLKSCNRYNHMSILLFNSVPEVHHASTLIGNNVKGYENSFIDRVNLLKMIQEVKKGHSWLFSELSNYIINQYIETHSSKEPEFMSILTQKEKEIALMIADGLSNKEIASSEKIALSTVKGHIGKIFEKAEVSDRISLALKFK